MIWKAIVFMLLGQAAWFAYMFHASKHSGDPSLGGAYWAVWMLGIPVVVLVSLAASMLIDWLT